MIDNNFSVTQYIIDPVLSLCQEDNSFLSKELAARIIAATTSIFAAADAFAHLSAGFLTQSATSEAHFTSASFFAKVTLIGSIAGIINPKALLHFEKTATLFPIPSREINIDEIIQDWPTASLREKSDISEQIHFETNNESSSVTRNTLVNTVYQSVDPLDHPVWEKQESPVRSNLRDAVYFHATSEDAFFSIIEQKALKVMHKGAYPGAFVSTGEPQINYGDFILCFRRNIERLSPLKTGFKADPSTYYAGFSKPIPVSTKTLACAIIYSSDHIYINAVQQRLSNLLGTPPLGGPIRVLSYDEAMRILHDEKGPNKGIPKEWQDQGEDVAANALETILERRPAQTTLAKDLKEPFIAIASWARSFFASRVQEETVEADLWGRDLRQDSREAFDAIYRQRTPMERTYMPMHLIA